MLKKSINTIILLIALIIPLKNATAEEQNDITNTNIPILLYHHIAWETNDNPSIVTPNKLWQDFMTIKELGYTPVFFKDILTAAEGKTNLPEKPIVISFDDGYLSNYQYLYPMQKIFNYKVNLNIIIDSVTNGPPIKDGLEYINWQQAKEMQKSGLMEFGVHTYRLHGPRGIEQMYNETIVEYEKRLTADTNKATTEYKKNLGQKPYIYCYPYGVYNDFAEELVNKKGYQVTLLTGNGKQHPLKEAQRTTITEETNLEQLLAPANTTDIPGEEYKPQVQQDILFTIMQ